MKLYLILIFVNLMTCWADQYKKLVIGEELELKCFPDDDIDTSTVVWTKDGVSITSSDRILVYRTGRLLIKRTEKGDAAKYECLLDNNDSETIIVTYVEPLPPKYSEYMGQNIDFPCKAFGGTPATEWNKDGALVTRSNRIAIETDRLLITNLTLVDAGDYICHIKYQDKEYTIETQLTVLIQEEGSNSVAIGIGVTFGILVLIAAILGAVYYKNVYYKKLSHFSP